MVKGNVAEGEESLEGLQIAYEMNIHLPNDQWTIHQLERLWMSLYRCFHVGNMWNIVKPLVSYYTPPSNRQLPVTHHHDCSLPERDYIHNCSDRWQFACTTWCCYHTWIKRYVQFWTLTYSCYLGLESWSFLRFFLLVLAIFLLSFQWFNAVPLISF